MLMGVIYVGVRCMRDWSGIYIGGNKQPRYDQKGVMRRETEQTRMVPRS